MGKLQEPGLGSRFVTRAIHRQMDVMLAAPYEAGARVVHVQRVSAKRIRAWLRLIEPDLGKEPFRRENLFFRDIARLLQNLRDSEMAAVTFDRLMTRLPGRISGATADLVSNALRHPHRPSPLSETVYIDVAHAVRKARVRLLDLRPNAGSTGVVRGLKRGFRKATALHLLARKEPVEIYLHDLRKESKYLMYQLEILADVWPKSIGELTGQLAELCEILGDDHDLVVLTEALAKVPLDAGESDLLKTLIREEGERLQAHAVEIGDAIYSDKAQEFIDGFVKRWRQVD